MTTAAGISLLYDTDDLMPLEALEQLLARVWDLRARVEARALGGPFNRKFSSRLDQLIVTEGNLARRIEQHRRWAA